MIKIALVLIVTSALAGCATSSKLLSEIEEAPKWFLDQIPEAEAAGYPPLAATPAKPDDLPALSSWEGKLKTLKTKGEEIVDETREHEGEISHNIPTREFLRSSLELADVEKFNAEEAMAEDLAKTEP